MTLADPTGHVHTDEALLRPRKPRRHWIVRALPFLLLAAVAVGIGWIALNTQRVLDQFTVWSFTPSAALEGYVDRSTMNDEGQFLFYASKPVIESGKSFNVTCSGHQENVGILGCYLPDDRTIFLFDVTDARLDGLEDTVAAHEMLHAAWDRMSDTERDTLAPLLEAEAATRADDPDFTATMAFYAKAEPGERLNELHSIIGTEFTSISPELETHYALYFSNRPALAALHEKAISVFREQQAAIDSLTAQLTALGAGIDTDYASYNAQYDTLEADIADFNARADSGSFSSQAQFTAERNALIARQDDLNAFYASIAARNAQYDDLVAQLTALNAQVDELNRSINIEPRGDSGL